MLKKDIKNGLTVKELKEAIKDLPDNTFVLLENLEDKLYYKNNYEDAVLTCDANQFSCFEFKQHGPKACKNCYLAHSYSVASTTVKADGVLYLNISI